MAVAVVTRGVLLLLWRAGLLGDRHQNDTISGTDLQLCANFQPNPFSSFGGDASQTDGQTNSKLNNYYLPHGNGGILT